MHIKKKWFNKMKIPEDLGVRIGTPHQVIWESAVKDTKRVIEELEKGLLINKAILELAEKKVEEEKEKT